MIKQAGAELCQAQFKLGLGKQALTNFSKAPGMFSELNSQIW
jgi:hypothetical protein